MWLLYDVNIQRLHPDTGREFSAREYVDYSLRREIKANKNISDLVLKYFTDRDCLVYKNEYDLMTKINKEVSSKKIKGKKLNGFSLCNIITEFMATKSPNINAM
jgi:hypothetical protein